MTALLLLALYLFGSLTMAAAAVAGNQKRRRDEMKRITTVRDLRNWVDEALGADGKPVYIDVVTDYLRVADHPDWGTDWSKWLAGQDVWHIVTALQM